MSGIPGSALIPEPVAKETEQRSQDTLEPFEAKVRVRQTGSGDGEVGVEGMRTRTGGEVRETDEKKEKGFFGRLFGS